MPQEQHFRALGIATGGDHAGWTLVGRGEDGVLQVLAHGQGDGMDQLTALCSPATPPAQHLDAVGIDDPDQARRAQSLSCAVPMHVFDPLEAHLIGSTAGVSGRPLVVLVASAHYTTLVRVDGPGRHIPLGHTLDITAGAVFDTLALQLGMDWPGGPALERLANYGDPTACALPAATPPTEGLDFSFTELQAAALERAHEHEGSPCELPRADLAASVQEAVVLQLVQQSCAALQRTGQERLVLSGGVTRNAALRQRLQATGVQVIAHGSALARQGRSARLALAALQQYANG